MQFVKGNSFSVYVLEDFTISYLVLFIIIKKGDTILLPAIIENLHSGKAILEITS
jgi:choline kinase